MKMTLEKWDERNSGKPVSKMEPLPEDAFIIYPNGIVLTTLEFLKKLEMKEAEA